MLEKMFTTKMSADKKKLQSRFSKIRSKNGRLSKLLGGMLFGIIIILIIGVGVIIAVNNTKDYQMTNDEFSKYIHRTIGSIMADIDYIDDERLVFHYLDGFFVMDRESNELIHKINLGKLNIAGHTQGDCYTEFKIDKDGNFAYLINGGIHNDRVAEFDNYIINIKTGEVKIGNMPEGTELFTNYADTFSTVNDIYGWCSDSCIKVNEDRTYYLTVQDSIIASIQLVTVNGKDNDVSMQYVFGKDYVSLAQHKVNVINDSLDEGEEILANSGLNWEVNENGVKAVLNKLSENMQMKHTDVPGGNYDVRFYAIWNNDSDSETQQMFILNNSTFELLFSQKLDEKVFAEVTSMLNMSKYESFHPKDIYNLVNAELVINYTRYPLSDKSSLNEIERMLSGAKMLKGGTACPYTASLLLTREDGVQGTITLATDSCAVFESGDKYYDYSDGDNSEMFGFFGFDNDTIIDMTSKR